MRDTHRPSARSSVARLLALALGLFGFVVAPAATGVPGGAPPAGATTGVRTGTVHSAPARVRASTRPRTAGRTQAVITAVVLHAAGAAAPGAQSAHATLPASVTEAAPSSWRLDPPAAAPPCPDVAPRGVPRERAPPATRI
jgi:hypothetical protein